MLVLITKASDSYWYRFKRINTLEDLFSIYDSLVIHPNTYNENVIDYWENFKKEDIPKLKEAKIEVMIYDDYIE